MERNGRIYSRILIACISINSCIGHDDSINLEGDSHDIEIHASCPALETRSGTPAEEDMIHDISIMAFYQGELEAAGWTQTDNPEAEIVMEIPLVSGREYEIRALANIGYPVRADRLEELSCMTIPYATDRGRVHRMPMSAATSATVHDNTGKLRLDMERMLARISVRMDRSRLDEGTDMTIRKISIRNCPAYMKPFGANAATGADSTSDGISLDEEDCMPMNAGEYISMYMPENMQGEFPYEISDADEKVFPENDMKAEACSYLEMEMSYLSPTLCSSSGNLIYRFYLGGSLADLNIERNCHYRITVLPEGDGLSDTGWRVDMSGIEAYTPSITMHPGTYMEGHVGEMLHIRCELIPEDTPLDLGFEELEYEKDRGMFDYMPDADGKGVMLTLKKPGTAMVYMTAGTPVNRSVMGFIVILP